jgi:hypothetical protein
MTARLSFLPRFSSRIRLVDTRTFFDETQGRFDPKTESSGGPWKMENRLVNVSRGITKNASVCLIGGMTNGKRMGLFHLIPTAQHLDPQGWAKIKAELSEDFKKLRAGGLPVRGFLMGGCKPSTSSVELYERMKSFFSSLGLPFSQIGLSRDFTLRHAAYETGSDTWILCIEDSGSGLFKKLDISNIHQFFDDIHIAPGDTIE